jgi:hypothetical protein
MRNILKSSMLLFSTIGLVSATLLLVSVPTSVMAQDDGPQFINIRVVTVKANKVSQFESLIKERSEHMQAAEQPIFHVYQRLRGPLNTYLIVTDGSKIPADPGSGPVPTENWFTAINDTDDSSSLSTLRIFPGTSTIEGASAPPTDYMFVRARSVAAGKNGDYQDWLRDDFIPAARKANLGDIRTAKIVLGGDPSMWITFSFVDGWPGEGNLLAESMGERGMERMFDKLNSITRPLFNYFYQFRSDLSYTSN